MSSKINGPSASTMAKNLGIDNKYAVEIKRLIDGNLHEKQRLGYSDRDLFEETAMKHANYVMMAFGVEALRDENAWVDGYWQNTIALYVNKGDTYDTTLLYDTENNRFLITSWGDFYESWLYKHQKEL